MPKKKNKIPPWGSWDLAQKKKSQALLNLLFEHFPKRNNLKLLEIGVYRGYNARYIIRQLTAKGYQVEYTGVDLFEDLSKIDSSKTNPLIHKTVVKTGKLDVMSYYNVLQVLEDLTAEITLLKGDSAIIVPKIEDLETYDFFYIDGGHNYSSVKKDWNNIYTRSKRGSLIVFDDGAAKGVNRLLKELREQGFVFKRTYGKRFYIIKS